MGRYSARRAGAHLCACRQQGLRTGPLQDIPRRHGRHHPRHRHRVVRRRCRQPLRRIHQGSVAGAGRRWPRTSPSSPTAWGRQVRRDGGRHHPPLPLPVLLQGPPADLQAPADLLAVLVRQAEGVRGRWSTCIATTRARSPGCAWTTSHRWGDEPPARPHRTATTIRVEAASSTAAARKLEKSRIRLLAKQTRTGGVRRKAPPLRRPAHHPRPRRRRQGQLREIRRPAGRSQSRHRGRHG